MQRPRGDARRDRPAAGAVVVGPPGGTAALRALAAGPLADEQGLPTNDPLRRSLADQAQAVGELRFALQLGYAAGRPGVLGRRPWLDKPLLVLSSDADTLCTPAMGDELLTIVRPSVPCRHRRAPHGGHLFPMQCPDWIAAQIDGFLPSVHEETT